MTERLSKSAWLDHGLASLAKDGPETLKAKVLCEALNVSRGSFYWHFADLGQFHRDLMDHWRVVTTQSVIAEFDPNMAPLAQLKGLVQRAASGDDALEKAMRGWAASNPEAAKIVKEVDQERLGYVAHLFQLCGLDGDTAKARGAMLYWSNIGRIVVGASSNAISADQLEAYVDALLSHSNTS